MRLGGLKSESGWLKMGKWVILSVFWPMHARLIKKWVFRRKPAIISELGGRVFLVFGSWAVGFLLVFSC